MAKTINDPVFGDLEYNNEGYWSKKIDFTLFGFKEHQIDLMVKCEKGEIISDIQRDAYKSYLVNMDDFEGEFPMSLLTYFKDHYEDLGRSHKMVEKLKIDLVNEDVSLDYFVCKSLFIDENGNYGWLANHIWKNNPISVILSDDKIRIYEDWAVLTGNYTRVLDDDLGELVYNSTGWEKWVKMDIGKEKGKWVSITFSSYGEAVNDKQREAYLEYKAHEAELYANFGEKLLAAYKDNYEWIEEWWQDDMPKNCTKEKITAKKLMEIIDFGNISFTISGEYGWCCECPWDEEHGLAIILEKGNVVGLAQQSELF